MILDLLLDVAIFTQYAILVSFIPALFAVDIIDSKIKVVPKNKQYGVWHMAHRTRSESVRHMVAAYIGIFLISFWIVGGPSAMLALFVLVSSVVICAMAYDAIRGGRRLVLA
tara:strand:+ start:5141 stop:5476 length:336 start_codon:yes stop_codon:yes gene_type:complete